MLDFNKVYIAKVGFKDFNEENYVPVEDMLLVYSNDDEASDAKSYLEVITQKQIIDSESDGYLFLDVIKKATAKELLTPDQMSSYFAQSKDDIIAKLENLLSTSINFYQKLRKSEIEELRSNNRLDFYFNNSKER